MYVKQMSKYLLVEILYVDDLIILACNETQLKWLKSELKKEFKINDLQKLHYCLGVEFKGNRKTHIIIINHKSYIKKTLKQRCKLVGTLFDVNSKLFKLSDEEFQKNKGKWKLFHTMPY